MYACAYSDPSPSSVKRTCHPAKPALVEAEASSSRQAHHTIHNTRTIRLIQGEYVRTTQIPAAAGHSPGAEQPYPCRTLAKLVGVPNLGSWLGIYEYGTSLYSVLSLAWSCLPSSPPPSPSGTRGLLLKHGTTQVQYTDISPKPVQPGRQSPAPVIPHK